MRYRHSVLVMVTVLVAGLAPHPVAGGELKFGFTPFLSESDMRVEFDPLMTYLSDCLGQKVILYVAKDYGDLRTQMESGAVDIGSFSPFAYVDAVRGGKIRIIAQSLMDGSATYRGVIVARRDSGLKSLAELRGKRFAFVDPKSASGFVYPRALLIEKGITPEKDFKETMFAGGHEKVIAAVLKGEADAGAVYEGAIAVEKSKGVPTENLVTGRRFGKKDSCRFGGVGKIRSWPPGYCQQQAQEVKRLPGCQGHLVRCSSSYRKDRGDARTLGSRTYGTSRAR